ncbi:hypothetical protein ES703_43615 [subsurface metagenome]
MVVRVELGLIVLFCAVWAILRDRRRCGKWIWEEAEAS